MTERMKESFVSGVLEYNAQDTSYLNGSLSYNNTYLFEFAEMECKNDRSPSHIHTHT